MRNLDRRRLLHQTRCGEHVPVVLVKRIEETYPTLPHRFAPAWLVLGNYGSNARLVKAIAVERASLVHQSMKICRSFEIKVWRVGLNVLNDR
jgi:hypothetical protein